MLNLSRGMILALLSSGLLASTACSNRTTQAIPAPSPPLEEAPTASNQSEPKPVTANLPDSYTQALDKADSAKSISQSATSSDDWNLVINNWQQAIKLLKGVPASSPNRKQVAAKLAEFERGLSEAKQQATRKPIVAPPEIPIPLPVNPNPAPGDSLDRVIRVPIKRRSGGTPVIDVLFNGRQTFEMIVDTGASGTVITQQMAQSLKVEIVGKAKVATASERDVEVPLGYMDSISVGGATKKGLIVGIDPRGALEIGLLGHDFYDNYDVTVKRDVVEFRPR